MINKFESEKAYKQGTKLSDDQGNKYKVLSCIDLKWLTEGKKDGFLVTVEVIQWI